MPCRDGMEASCVEELLAVGGRCEPCFQGEGGVAEDARSPAQHVLIHMGRAAALSTSRCWALQRRAQACASL